MESPYKRLHIYWINRPLKREEEEIFDDSFIGNWVEDDYSFLFFKKDAKEKLNLLLNNDNELKILDKYEINYDQWQGKFYEPIRISNFIIIPSWYRIYQFQEGLIPIVLDPGVVFGNCLHPTTRHCISAISEVMEKYRIKNVIDLGTGTGILAIVAAKLGAEKVWAVDINPLCIKTSKNNFKKNGLSNKIEAIHISAQDALKKYKDIDLVVANLSYDVIVQLMEINQFFRKVMILSGMLRSQWSEIRYRLERRGYKILKEWDYEMTWFTSLVLKKEVF